jgi:hypothetical protein
MGIFDGLSNSWLWEEYEASCKDYARLHDIRCLELMADRDVSGLNRTLVFLDEHINDLWSELDFRGELTMGDQNERYY